MIVIRKPDEIENIRIAGKIVHEVLEVLSKKAASGMTTDVLDSTAERIIRDSGGMPAFKNYRGYPRSICSSVNSSVVHEIPSMSRVLIEGDIIGFDVGVGYNGYFADAAVTVGIGKISDEARRLISVTKRSLELGLQKAIDGNRLSDISYAIQSYVEANKFSVVRHFVGHGIGRQLHEDPEIPNYGPPKRGPVLKDGMVLAIEPMINQGTYEVKILPDGWTAVTKDGKLSAHWEHTIVVRKGKAEIMT